MINSRPFQSTRFFDHSLKALCAILPGERVRRQEPHAIHHSSIYFVIAVALTQDMLNRLNSPVRTF